LNRNQPYWIALVLALLGLGLFLYKLLLLGFPIVPEKKVPIWNVEAHIGFKAINEPVRVSLSIPRNTERFAILDENFISRSYGLTTKIDNGQRKALWTVRQAKGQQELYYRASIHRTDRKESSGPPSTPKLKKPAFEGATLAAVETIIAEVQQKSADTDSMVTELIKRVGEQHPDENILLLLGKNGSLSKKVELIVNILSMADVAARAVHGIRLDIQRRDVPLIHWLEVYDNKQWISYNILEGDIGFPDDHFPWWKGSGELLQIKGAESFKVTLSVFRSQEEALRATFQVRKGKAPFLINFSLFNLPLQTQAVYRVLLLVPIGAFLIVILRNVIGVRTFGTFMPVLIALAFRETQLIWGLLMFSVLVALGLSVRLYLEHLKLLVVPRLASVLIVVILWMVILSMLTFKLDLSRGLSVALFPMVILTMTIERMSVLWEELGSREALIQGIGSLIVSALIYLVITVDYLEYLTFVFPELLLVLLAGTIVLGRYSGYRILELRRFKSLSDGKS